MLLQEALERFVAYASPRWSFKYIASTKKLFREWAALWGLKDLNNIKSLDIEERYLARLALGLSGGRLNFERNLLKRFFRWAKEHELCERNPVSTWPKHPENAKEARILPIGAEQALIPLLPQTCQRLAWVALYTGLRHGTLRKLTWKDVIDRADGYRSLLIPPAKMKMKRGLEVPLTLEASKALGERPAIGGALFPEAPWGLMSWHYLKTAGREIGLDPAPGLHDLRKTAA